MPFTNSIEKVVLLRHGETDQHEALDPFTPINETGKKQAVCVGQEFDGNWLWACNIFCSSHLRCRQTLEGMCAENESFRHAKVFYDPNLREVEYGPGVTWEDIEYELKCSERKKSKFYYRFKGGESPADAYIRACLFWESAQRQAYRSGKKNLLVISHGMMIRVLVMRWMHWLPEDYDKMVNVGNCQPVQIVRDGLTAWKVEGLSFS